MPGEPQEEAPGLVRRQEQEQELGEGIGHRVRWSFHQKGKAGLGSLFRAG